MDVVASSPTSIAVSDGDTLITYNELDMRVHALALKLARMGVGPETVIGVSLAPSKNLIVCMLAIWRAGGVYLPLETDLPVVKLEYRISNSGCRLVLCSFEHLKTFENIGIAAFNVDQSSETELLNFVLPAISSATDESELAYIIYTSGSTGRPKGVEGTHRSLFNRLNWGLRTFPIVSDDVCCIKTSIGFVDSIAEILVPLVEGGRLEIAPDQSLDDPPAFVDFLSRNKVSRLVAVPSLLKLVCAVLFERNETLPLMNLVVSSGEALSPWIAANLFSTMPNARLVNVYGSSETGADATYHEVCEPVDVDCESIPIGKPLGGAICLLLDENGDLLQGVAVGELYVSGPGLARGYRNNEKETFDRFTLAPTKLGRFSG